MTLWQFVDIRCLRPIVHHSFTSSTQQDSENVVINIKILSSYGQLFTWLALSSKSLPCSHVEMTCEMFVSHVVWRSCTIWHNMSAMPAQVMLQTVKHAPTSNLWAPQLFVPNITLYSHNKFSDVCVSAAGIKISVSPQEDRAHSTYLVFVCCLVTTVPWQCRYPACCLCLDNISGEREGAGVDTLTGPDRLEH